MCYNQCYDPFVLSFTFTHQVSEQMKTQASPSSSIIIVLTDGKLEVYPFELTLQEVSNTRTHFTEDNSNGSGSN